MVTVSPFGPGVSIKLKLLLEVLWCGSNPGPDGDRVLVPVFHCEGFVLVCFLIWELIQDRFVGFGLSTFGNPLKFICRWDFLLVERTRSRQKWRQEECGRAPVCEGKLMRRLAWRARGPAANRGRS